MMVGRVLSADFLKMRRKGIWLLVFLGSVGLIALQVVNFGLRYDYLIGRYQDDLWKGLIGEIFSFVPIALFLGTTLIASQIANVEHQNNSWKQLLALPVTRTSVFTAKFLLGVIALAISCLILSCGTIALGLALKFSAADIPYLQIFKLSFIPFLAALPLFALQLWLSLTFKNQALPVTIGITAAIASLFAGNYPEWFPLTWPLLAFSGKVEPALPVGAGIILAFIIYLFGVGHFHRKDVD